MKKKQRLKIHAWSTPCSAAQDGAVHGGHEADLLVRGKAQLVQQTVASRVRQEPPKDLFGEDVIEGAANVEKENGGGPVHL